MTESEIEGQLWFLANAITAFSVLQAITGLYAVAKGDFTEVIAKHSHFTSGILAAAVVCCCTYSFAVWFCNRLALQLPTAHPHIWRQLTAARIAAIVLFQAIAVGGFLISTQ